MVEAWLRRNMSKIYLPIGYKPTLPDDKRGEYMNRIYDSNYLLPGAENMELALLKDFAEFAEKRYAEDLYTEELKVAKGSDIVDNMSKEQTKGALREFLNWRAKKKGKPKPYAN